MKATQYSTLTFAPELALAMFVANLRAVRILDLIGRRLLTFRGIALAHRFPTQTHPKKGND